MQYDLGSVKRAFKSPQLVTNKIERYYFSKFSSIGDGVDILSRDWDILCILDACRYDQFEELIDIPGDLEKVRSRASATNQFLRRNFSGKNATDTIYVTGNPQYYRIQNGIYNVDPINCEFYDVVNVWKDNWDVNHRTVRPEVVTDAAIKAARSHQKKRILVHYLQPHAPYIGTTGSKHLQTDVLDFWSSYRTGEIDVDINIAKKAYQENLQLVLSDVKRLVKKVKGKIVITADHGEMLGERSGLLPIKKFGHPVGIHTPELIEVPWFVYESGPRMKKISEKPIKSESTDIDDEKVMQRLEDLGYSK